MSSISSRSLDPRDSYAVRLQSCSLNEIDTIVIACDEAQALPSDEVLEKFGTCAVIQARDLEIAFDHPESPLSILISNFSGLCKSLRKLIVCTHTSCSMHKRGASSGPPEGVVQSDTSNCHRLGIKEKMVLLRLRKRLSRYIEAGVLNISPSVEIYGCVYDAEPGSTAAYDSTSDCLSPVESVSGLLSDP